MQLHDAPDDLQADAGRVWPAIAGDARAKLLMKQASVIAHRHAWAGTGRHLDGSTPGRVPDGVFDEIADGVLDQRRVTLDLRGAGVLEGNRILVIVDPRRNVAYDRTARARTSS